MPYRFQFGITPFFERVETTYLNFFIVHLINALPRSFIYVCVILGKITCDFSSLSLSLSNSKFTKSNYHHPRRSLTNAVCIEIVDYEPKCISFNGQIWPSSVIHHDALSKRTIPFHLPYTWDHFLDAQVCYDLWNISPWDLPCNWQNQFTVLWMCNAILCDFIDFYIIVLLHIYFFDSPEQY